MEIQESPILAAFRAPPATARRGVTIRRHSSIAL